MSQLVTELRDVLEKGGTNWYGYKEVSLSVKRLEENVKDERYERIPDLIHRIETAVYKLVPKLKPGTVEKRTGYTKVKAKLLELARPTDKSKGNSFTLIQQLRSYANEKSPYDELAVLIERVQNLAYSLWESDHQAQANAASGPSHSNVVQSLDYMEQKINETGRLLRRMDRLRKDLVGIHNTLRMIKIKPRQREIADREEIKDSDTLEQICASLMKLSDTVVDAATTQDISEGSQQRLSEKQVQEKDKNDLQHMQEWVNWLESSLKTETNFAKQPSSHSEKRLKQHLHTTDRAANTEKVIKSSADKITRLKQELEMSTTSKQQLEDKLSSTIKELQQENIQLMKEMGKNKKGVPSNRRPSLYGTDREEVQKEIEALKRETKRLTDDLREANKQKQHWMNKLSKMTGAKSVKEITPYVDFSDPNRPEKLSERVGELYDNEWKSSLAIISSKDPSQQRDAILQLATILKLSYQHCVHVSSQQFRKLYDALFNLEDVVDQNVKTNGKNTISDDQQKTVGDLQRHSATNMKDIVLDTFHEKLKKNKMEQTLEKIPQYFKECIEICWYMTVNDPPLIFFWPDEDGKVDIEVDLDKFTYYTLIGDVIDFVVWPAMLTENSGTLLRKGVVEPFDKK